VKNRGKGKKITLPPMIDSPKEIKEELTREIASLLIDPRESQRGETEKKLKKDHQNPPVLSLTNPPTPPQKEMECGESRSCSQARPREVRQSSLVFFKQEGSGRRGGKRKTDRDFHFRIENSAGMRGEKAVGITGKASN